MNKLKEINGKYYQECEVVMLATDKAMTNNSQLFLYPDGQILKSPAGNQHLYFLSNEEIKEGDWCYNKITKQITQAKTSFYGNFNWVKIIATTDTPLTIIDYVDCEYPLPQPSKSFIQAYIKAYNEGNPIKWVNVEYEEYFESIIVSLSNFVDEEQLTTKYKLKVDKNNYITITKVKDSWTRKEMFDCWLYSKGLVLREETDQIKRERIQFNKWIEQNL